MPAPLRALKEMNVREKIVSFAQRGAEALI